MFTLANILLGLACLLWFFLTYAAVVVPANQSHEGGEMVTVATIAVASWAILMAFPAVLAAQDSFAWLTSVRGAQIAAAILAHAAVSVIIWLSAAFRSEAAGAEIPWLLRPLLPWSIFVLPPAIMALTFVELNWGVAAPRAARLALASLEAVALFAGAGLLVQWFGWQLERQSERVNEILEAQDERERTRLAEVEAMDPGRDLPRLLAATNKYEKENVRELAVRKVMSHPRLTAELANLLRGDWCGEALTFLESNEPPDPAALTGAVEDAIEQVAARVRRRMRSEHWLYDDSFDREAERILAVAVRMRPHGGSYAGAVRAFRRALDEPRGQAIQPRCRKMLDEWLAKA